MAGDATQTNTKVRHLTTLAPRVVSMFYTELTSGGPLDDVMHTSKSAAGAEQDQMKQVNFCKKVMLTAHLMN